MKKKSIHKKSTRFVAAFFAAALCMVSCTTAVPGTGGGGVSVARGRPVIGAEGIVQPDWVRKLPEMADFVYFVGEGRKGKTPTARESTSRASALQKLSEWKQSKTAAIIRDYVNESGETDNTQSLESLENAILVSALANTSSLKPVESWISADERYIGLYAYPINDFRQDFKNATNKFVRNKSAEAAEIKAAPLYKKLEENLSEMD